MSIWFLVRAVHILAGVFWVGGAITVVFFLLPAIRASGAAGGTVMRHMAATARFPVAIHVAAAACTACGAALLAAVAPWRQPALLLTPAGALFTLGCAAGIGALLWGTLVQSRRVQRLGQSMSRAQGQPTAEQAAAIQRFQAQVRRGGFVGVSLLIVALIGMVAVHPL